MNNKHQNEETKAEKKSKGDKVPRAEWQGLGMCEFLRYAGSQGWDRKLIAEVAQVIGFSPSATTIYIQSKKGKDGENVPDLGKEITNELKAHYEEAEAKAPKLEKPKGKAKGKPAEEAEPPAKKGKAAKAKAGKSKE